MLPRIFKRRYKSTCRAMVSKSESTIPAPISTEGERGIQVMVHGDDFISSGSRCALAWLRTILEARFELMTAVVGHGASDAREGRALNRIIRTTADGWEYEGDQRHADFYSISAEPDRVESPCHPLEKTRRRKRRRRRSLRP